MVDPGIRYNRTSSRLQLREMERKPQTYANHAKFDPQFHFFLAPIGLLMVIGSIWAVISNPGWHSLRYLVLSLWLVVLMFRTRIYSLRQQDRIIRLEERLRLSTVLPESLRSRIPELREGQLIALRFASDGELPALVQRTLSENLAPKQIKQSITSWRPDYWRI
jgi:hypothetical protein